MVLAGPNGSGKSTFFDECLADRGLLYVNADRIAAALQAIDASASQDKIDRHAFSLAEAFRAAFAEAALTFCTETVFSDSVGAKLKFLEQASRRGYYIILIFIGLDSSDLSIARVKHRVEHGGHDIPNAKLDARFPRVLANLRAAVPLVSEAFLFDNSSFDEPYRPVAVFRRGELIAQYAPLPWWTAGLPGL